MVVCRYFLQGNCRFGDRCRFVHPESNQYHDQRNEEHYQQRQGYGQSNYYRQGNQYRNDRYDSNNYYNDRQRNYSPERYSDDYRHESKYPSNAYNRYESKYSSNGYNNYRHESKYPSNAYNNQQHNKFKKDYEEEYPPYNDYGRNQHYSNDRNVNTYGQNRFRWLSEDYKKQEQHNVSNESKFTNRDYSTSTPKDKVLFSFKAPESEIKKDSSFSHYPVDEQDQLHAERVKEDAKSWELGGLWPFTCYYPYTDKYAFPGFSDISPEELRFAAYKAEENNAYDSYVQSVQNALVEITEQRSNLQITTPELLAVIRRIRNGENICTTSKAIASIPFLHPDGITSEEIHFPAAPGPSTNIAASFSFKIATDGELSVKSSATNFSFKIPSASEPSLAVSTVSSGDPDIYTSVENLTQEEKEQFMASTFELGKIPTKPPPQMLCI